MAVFMTAVTLFAVLTGVLGLVSGQVALALGIAITVWLLLFAGRSALSHWSTRHD